MAKRKIAAGSTGITIPVQVLDYTSTVGAGLAGLVFNTSGLVAEYRRQGQSSFTAITMVAGTLGTWSSGGWVAAGALAGRYEFGIPDAVLASGARWAELAFYGAPNMVPVVIEIELDAVNYQDAVRFGLTAIPNVVQGNTGQLPTADASGRVVALDVVADVSIDLTQALTNVKTATVGGALHGSWISAFGKMVRDATAKTLTLFGISATAVQVHDLDDGTNPTTRTPE